MDVIYLGQGPWVEIEAVGTVVTVMDMDIDCADHQCGVPTTVDVVVQGDGQVALLASPAGDQDQYVASINIPAVSYTQEEEVSVPVPLDPERVSVRLWSYCNQNNDIQEV